MPGERELIPPTPILSHLGGFVQVYDADAVEGGDDFTIQMGNCTVEQREDAPTAFELYVERATNKLRGARITLDGYAILSIEQLNKLLVEAGYRPMDPAREARGGVSIELESGDEEGEAHAE